MSKYLELVEGSFTQEHLDKQKNQKPYVAYSIKDGKVIYSIIPKEGGTMYTVYRVVSKDISNCIYNMVDLGLSVKWADRNVGASSPEHYGSYFQWGDTEGFTYDGKGEITAAQLATVLQPLVGDEMEVTADNVHDILTLMLGGDPGYDMSILGLGASIDKEFNWDSYNEVDVITSWEENEDGYRYPTGFKKYNNSENGLTVLESGDDAAAVYMGAQYRMPTIDEIRELIEDTTQTFIDLDGNEYDRQYVYDNEPIESGKLKGVRFTSSNGNSIFIPAAGFCHRSLLDGIDMYGELWSSSLGDGYDSYAKNLYFDYGGGVSKDVGSRYYGRSVRGVEFKL